MNNLKTVELNQLFHEFNICTQLQYDGQLKINNLDGKQWTFYYCSGKIVWATGGTHPYRRFRRNITQFCTHINVDHCQLFSENTLLDYWDYFLLKRLYQTQKIEFKQVNAIVKSTISELLFDLAQETDFQSLSYDYNEEVILGKIMTSSITNIFFQQTQESCESWLKAGLEGLSPNLAPMIIKPEIIQQKVSADIYKNLENLINGKHTLYDLSVKMKQNVLSISRSLLPHIKKGIVVLVEVPDLPLDRAKIQNNYSSISTKKNSRISTIACVDNNSQVYQMLETFW